MWLTILLGIILAICILILIAVCCDSDIPDMLNNILNWFSELLFDWDDDVYENKSVEKIHHWINKYFKNFWK